jgi:hypothetical protein
VSDRGFGLRPTPEPIHKLLTSLWELGQEDLRPEEADPAYFPDGDPELLPIGPLGDEVLNFLKPLHEEWAGVRLRPVTAYGMRVYRSGQRMAMHIERPDTHVVSSMVVVAQDVDAPWPLHLDLDDRRHELSVQPGQMLFYEGAANPHGHVTPLSGRFFSVLLLHYSPMHWPHSVESLVTKGLRNGIIDAAGRLQPLPRADPRWASPNGT